MDSEIQTRMLGPNDPLQGLVMEMVSAMHAIAGPLTQAAGDPRDGISALMTAASMYAGSQFGTLLVLGAVDQKDTRRAVEAAGRNFREGIKVGLTRAARIEAEQLGGRA